MPPVTALLLPDPKGNGHKRIKFVTQDFEHNLSIDIYQCDENWIEVGQPTEGTHVDNEELYHKTLREEAEKRGHYVPEESTNSEWNPGYVVPDEFEEHNSSVDI